MSPRFTTLYLSATASTVVLAVSCITAADHTTLAVPAVFAALASGMMSLLLVPWCVAYAAAEGWRSGWLEADRTDRLLRRRPQQAAAVTGRHAIVPETMARREPTATPVSPASDQPAPSLVESLLPPTPPVPAWKPTPPHPLEPSQAEAFAAAGWRDPADPASTQSFDVSELWTPRDGRTEEMPAVDGDPAESDSDQSLIDDLLGNGWEPLPMPWSHRYARPRAQGAAR